MSLSEQFNIGARIIGVNALTTQITQTSAAAATTQDGLTIDRNATGRRRYYSCKFIASGQFLYAASSAHIATVPSLNVQHSSDGTSWDNYSTGTVPSAVTWGSSSGGAVGTTAGTASNQIEQSVNLNKARQYIRVQVPAPTFSDCSSGSVLTVGVTCVFGGGDELPAQ